MIRRIVTVVGSVLMILGVFLPMLSIPLLHDDTYFELSRGGGYTILALGGLGILIAVFGKFRLLYLTALVALGLLIYTYFQIDKRKTVAQSDLRERVIDSPLKGLSEGIVSKVGLRYGWPTMMVGAGITLAVPLVGSRLSRKEKD
ncbi:hypothetical protein C3F09_00655 [candidate division GN15 bacterium]|uniref:Uncharacterized protein n=1 Tax=candidate division GN15 bacterium TaxID=2072418 RepID=A0A855XE04_9BACT|nr:MAG: hypothetical protein C3F09_00655 [candidate division GN15 bacterium]